MYMCLKVHKNEEIGNMKLKFFSSCNISYNEAKHKIF